MMTTSKVKIFYLFVVVVLATLSKSTSAADGSDRPNIIMIFADDWGWGDLSCHGNTMYQTPNLDQLASQGTEFHQFTVNNPVCSPSRTAVMTGQFPARHSVHQHFATIEHHVRSGMPDWLNPSAPMLPRILKKSGYVTAHYGKWHLTNRKIADAPLPSKYGYDEYGAFNLPGPQVTVDEAYDKTIDFIRRHKDKPFFMNLWIHETHTPHYPKKKWLEKFKHLDEQQQTYAAVVGYADERIGDVLKTLEECGIEENTLVVFSSDNGPEKTGPATRTTTEDDSTGPGLGTWFSVGTTGGLKGRKRSLFEGGVRVPFIVRWPGKVPAGKVDGTTVITAVDLLPTFCAAAEIELPDDYQSDGQNMLAAFQGEPTQRSQPIFWEWRGSRGGPNWPRLGVRDSHWKLLMTNDQKRIELYRHPQDRSETNNLAEKHPDIVKKLSKMALIWQKTLPSDPPVDCFSDARTE